MVRLKSLLTALFLTIIFCHAASSLSVMSLDLGNEWIKVAIVSPGKPMEIVLNTDSQRKTPLIVAFRDGERFFGEAALTTNARFPEKAFMYLLDLIGKRIDSPSVRLYQKRFPYHNITTNEAKTQLFLHHPEGMVFTPEELLAMIIQKGRSFAEHAAGDGQKITDAVISIHPFMNQLERRAILRAAQIAGIKVLQLMNTNTAVALNYGVFRYKDFNESSATNVLFYDTGASMTIATLASYSVVKSKERGFIETNPQLAINGVGFDRHLGGIEMQMRLRNHLAKLFAKQRNKKLQEVTTNKRAMSKLLKEAARLKKVLSANSEHLAQVENVMNDLDLKAMVTRSEFEELCADLLDERVVRPIVVALESAGMAVEALDQVILFGGNTRVPRIQAALSAFFAGKELSKSVNADEAAALGAAYEAAALSKGFKVKTFLVKDTNLYPIQVEFSRLVEQEDTSTKVKQMQRILFPRNNPFPQKKVLTFSRHTGDFEFFINYADLSAVLTPADIRGFGELNITRVSVGGVEEILARNSGADKDSKGIKAHFRMDESGLLNLDGVEAVFEARVEERVDEPRNVVGDTLAKLGNTIGKLFGRAAGEADEEGQVQNANETSAEEASGEKLDSQNGTSGTGNNANATQGNGTTSSINGTDTAAPKVEIKLKTIKEPIIAALEFIGLDTSDEDLIASKSKLETLQVKDVAKQTHERSKNNLESFIVETRVKLYDNEYELASTEAEREKIMADLSMASEWLEYESDDAETSVFKEKHKALKTTCKELFERVLEHRRRPEALAALKEMLNISRLFLDGARAIKPEDQIFTDVELDTLTRVIESTDKWWKTDVAEQEELPLTSNPKVLVKAIAEKISQLDREVKYLVTKARIAPPKKKPEPVEEEVTKAGPKDEEESKKEEASGTSDGETLKNRLDSKSFQMPELPPEIRNISPEVIQEMLQKAKEESEKEASEPMDPTKSKIEDPGHTEL